MLSILGFVTGPIGKIVGIVSIVASLAGGIVVVIHEHDANVRAALVATQQTTRIATIKADAALTISALETTQKQAANRLAAMASTRKAITNAPITNACAASPAIGAAVDGLRIKRP